MSICLSKTWCGWVKHKYRLSVQPQGYVQSGLQLHLNTHRLVNNSQSQNQKKSIGNFSPKDAKNISTQTSVSPLSLSKITNYLPLVYGQLFLSVVYLHDDLEKTTYTHTKLESAQYPVTGAKAKPVLTAIPGPHRPIRLAWSQACLLGLQLSKPHSCWTRLEVTNFTESTVPLNPVG